VLRWFSLESGILNIKISNEQNEQNEQDDVLYQEEKLDLIFKEEFYQIKKACIEVRKRLGNGFLEKVYEKALCIELKRFGFIVETQKKIIISYRNQIIGEYFADIVVNNKIIIELKCVEKLNEFHKAQLLNYLKATNLELGILINFPNNRKGFEIERVPNLIDKK